jgi:hypothetical protein
MARLASLRAACPHAGANPPHWGWPPAAIQGDVSRPAPSRAPGVGDRSLCGAGFALRRSSPPARSITVELRRGSAGRSAFLPLIPPSSRSRMSHSCGRPPVVRRRCLIHFGRKKGFGPSLLAAPFAASATRPHEGTGKPAEVFRVGWGRGEEVERLESAEATSRDRDRTGCALHAALSEAAAATGGKAPSEEAAALTKDEPPLDSRLVLGRSTTTELCGCCLAAAKDMVSKQRLYTSVVVLRTVGNKEIRGYFGCCIYGIL